MKTRSDVEPRDEVFQRSLPELTRVHDVIEIDITMTRMCLRGLTMSHIVLVLTNNYVALSVGS